MKRAASVAIGVVIFALALALNALGFFSIGSVAEGSAGQSATSAQVERSSAPADSDASAAGQASTSQASSQKATSQASGRGSRQSGSAASGQDGAAEKAEGLSESATGGVSVVEDGTYTSKDEVAAYIHEFGRLPSNFISKTKARNAGWESSKGNLDEVLPGMSIGGSVFYDDDDQLPDAPGRTWKECDINYTGGYRGSERIVFSNDGLVYYTADHYKTFERLY